MMPALMAVFGLFLLVPGVRYYIKNRKIMRRSKLADGVVIGLIKRIHFDKDEYYHPEIEYSIDGVRGTFIGSIGSDPPSYKVGNAVKVIMEIGDSKNVYVYDWWFRYGPVSIVAIGVILEIISLSLWCTV